MLIVDNFGNSKPSVVNRLEALTDSHLPVHSFDLRDHDKTSAVFTEQPIDAVIHFAGLKAVGESVREPADVLPQQPGGHPEPAPGDGPARRALNRLQLLRHGLRGTQTRSPTWRKWRSAPTTPTAGPRNRSRTSSPTSERRTDRWHIALLRYFNPVGAHPSGRIGEDPQGIPNNLVPFIAQVAVGRREKLMVFGADYDTPDGTCLRDYIHVVDLAEGHLAALNHVAARTGVFRWNLGSGQGSSVLEVLHSFEKAVGRPIPYELTGRRAGDLPAFWADATSALADLGWSTTKTVDQMCEDHWRWQNNNPHGYTDA